MSSHRLRRRRLTSACWLLVAVAVLAGACSSGDDEATSSADGDADRRSISRDRVDASFDVLDRIVARAMEETGVPGIAAAVVHDDEVVYTQGYGVRQVGKDEPVTPETVFQVASLSKPISSTVMAGLVGDGVITWDDPLVDHDPEVQLSDEWVTDHVTFADVFSHRSGLPGAAGNDLEALGYERETILERLRYVPLDPFRITYSYSNFAMTLGGQVAAEAAGASWEDVAEQVLFESAGMDSTSMREADFRAEENRAEPHLRRADGWQAGLDRHPDPQAPAGGVSSNVEDLANWLRLQLAGGSLGGKQIIDEEALDATHTPQIMRSPPQPTIADPAGFYGLGWNIETDDTGAVRWNHSGAFSTGAATTAKLLPGAGVGIVVLTNGEPIGVPEAITDAYLSWLQTGDAHTEDNLDLWQERFSHLYGEPVEDWAHPPADPAPARTADAYVGTYTNDYVGAVEVTRAPDGGLQMAMGAGPTTFPLTHWDGDTFSYVDTPELPEMLAAVTFDVGPDGVASAVDISTFDGVGQGTLQRT